LFPVAGISTGTIAAPRLGIRGSAPADQGDLSGAPTAQARCTVSQRDGAALPIYPAKTCIEFNGASWRHELSCSHGRPARSIHALRQPCRATIELLFMNINDQVARPDSIYLGDRLIEPGFLREGLRYILRLRRTYLCRRRHNLQSDRELSGERNWMKFGQR